ADAQLIKAQVVSFNNNPSLSKLDEVSLVSDEVYVATGMATPKLQGDNPEITELDKYREVITGLLEALSGEIRSPKGNPSSLFNGFFNLGHAMEKLVQAYNNSDTGGQPIRSVEGTTALQPESAVTAYAPNPKVPVSLQALSGEIQALSSKGNFIGPESVGIKDLGQDGKTLLDEVAKNAQISLSPKGNSISSENNGIMDIRQVIAKIAQGLKAFTGDVSGNGQVPNDQRGLKPPLGALNQQTGSAIATQGINGVEVGTAPTGKGSSEPPIEQLKGTYVDPVGTQVRDTAFPKDVRRKPEGNGMDFRSTQSVEPSAVHDVQNQNSNTDIGVVSNSVAANIAGGKTVAIPVWEQISTAFREQVLNRHQALKELDIQLHPVDLGKIQIAMRWENGQVHLVIQASEATTGQLLQNQLSDLRQNLTNQGVNCGMLQMGQGGEQRQNHRGDESRRRLNHNFNLNEDENQIPVIDPLFLGQDGNNRINVTA
ncbi:MAG: flagellar hook-length control protein FliK, partial [Desulfosporosinus sp.]